MLRINELEDVNPFNLSRNGLPGPKQAVVFQGQKNAGRNLIFSSVRPTDFHIFNKVI